MDTRLKHRCSTPQCRKGGWARWASTALWHKRTGKLSRVCDKCAERLLATGEYTMSKPNPRGMVDNEQA